MAEIRLRDYESADAEGLNRIAVSAFDQFRYHYSDWPAMLAGLSKTSDLSASGEVIVAELHDKFTDCAQLTLQPARIPKAIAQIEAVDRLREVGELVRCF